MTAATTNLKKQETNVEKFAQIEQPQLQTLEVIIVESALENIQSIIPFLLKNTKIESRCVEPKEVLGCVQKTSRSIVITTLYRPIDVVRFLGLCRLLKKEIKTNRVRIVLFSRWHQKIISTFFKELGCQEYIEEPIPKRDLALKLSNQVKALKGLPLPPRRIRLSRRDQQSDLWHVKSLDLTQPEKEYRISPSVEQSMSPELLKQVILPSPVMLSVYLSEIIFLQNGNAVKTLGDFCLFLSRALGGVGVAAVCLRLEKARVLVSVLNHFEENSIFSIEKDPLLAQAIQLQQTICHETGGNLYCPIKPLPSALSQECLGALIVEPLETGINLFEKIRYFCSLSFILRGMFEQIGSSFEKNTNF